MLKGTNKEKLREHGNIGKKWRGTRTPPGRPSRFIWLACKNVSPGINFSFGLHARFVFNAVAKQDGGQ